MRDLRIAICAITALVVWRGGHNNDMLKYFLLSHPVAGAQYSNSATGTRARVARVRAEYPDQLDYSGVASSLRK